MPSTSTSQRPERRRCPACNAVIEDVNYNETCLERVTYYGRADFDGEIIICDDSSDHDPIEHEEITYECPICNAEISLYELDPVEEENEETEKPPVQPEPAPDYFETRSDFMLMTRMEQARRGQCPCGHATYSLEADIMACEDCGEPIPDTRIEIMRNGKWQPIMPESIPAKHHGNIQPIPPDHQRGQQGKGQT